jgi:hypothetical protein
MFEFIASNPIILYLAFISLFFFICGCVTGFFGTFVNADIDGPMFLFAAAFWPITSIMLLLLFIAAGISTFWETYISSSEKIGDIVVHPAGYKVKIVDGQYWGTYGVSNHWYWKKVLKNGKLSKKVYNGYGWW